MSDDATSKSGDEFPLVPENPRFERVRVTGGMADGKIRYEAEVVITASNFLVGRLTGVGEGADAHIAVLGAVANAVGRADPNSVKITTAAQAGRPTEVTIEIQFPNEKSAKIRTQVSKRDVVAVGLAYLEMFNDQPPTPRRSVMTWGRGD